MRASLFAIRAQVDALLLQLDEGAKECPHPPQARRDLSVMGGPERYECRACGRVIDGGEAATT